MSISFQDGSLTNHWLRSGRPYSNVAFHRGLVPLARWFSFPSPVQGSYRLTCMIGWLKSTGDCFGDDERLLRESLERKGLTFDSLPVASSDIATGDPLTGDWSRQATISGILMGICFKGSQEQTGFPEQTGALVLQCMVGWLKSAGNSAICLITSRSPGVFGWLKSKGEVASNRGW